MEKYFVTGNEFISIPTIREDASIESINFLHMGYRGLVEICGSPLIKPVFKTGSKCRQLENIQWEYNNYWIPEFNGHIDKIKIKGTICAPLGHRGFIYNFEIENGGNEINYEIGLEGIWDNALHSINESKRIEGKKHIYYSNWNRGPMFDFINGITLFSFGYICSDSLDNMRWGKPDAVSKDIYSCNEEVVEYVLSKNITLKKGESYKISFYLGIGLEEVGAAASAINMQRHGEKNLYSETLKWLGKRIRYTGNKVLDKIFNLNIFFNYFYSSGRTIDTEEIVLVTSRSPRYYVSAAYWDRDSLLWSFPSQLLVDTGWAKEALYYVFERQIKNVGVHSRYIDGTVLEPGFELDELCAPVIALSRYMDHTGDKGILHDSPIKRGIYRILEIIDSKKHEKEDLYETFLMPTDDMNQYPYLTYNNALVSRTFQIVSRILSIYGDTEGSIKYFELSSRIKEAVYKNCITLVNGEKIFAWSVDLEGRSSVYDEPPGSLTLLPYYRFCSFNDEIYKNTVKYLYSGEFNHYFSKGNFCELGCTHADHPWILAIANSLLNGRKKEALDMLVRAPLDNGIACESIDEYTGECVTGAHFATCAGFLSSAIYDSFIKKD